jgi:adenylate kinase family enzyme
MENVATWQTLIGDKVNLLGVVHFELSFAQMEERLIRRGIDSGRSDDTQDAIKTRLNIYKE